MNLRWKIAAHTVSAFLTINYNSKLIIYTEFTIEKKKDTPNSKEREWNTILCKWSQKKESESNVVKVVPHDLPSSLGCLSSNLICLVSSLM